MQGKEKKLDNGYFKCQNRKTDLTEKFTETLKPKISKTPLNRQKGTKSLKTDNWNIFHSFDKNWKIVYRPISFSD